MKLKNKKTGEIKEFTLFDGNELQGGATLESLTEVWEDYEEPKEVWEDYEEPKEFWHILPNGGVINKTDNDNALRQEFIEGCKQIGNYFETKEEAELAVRKLKAWKRLRDKGFRFENWVWSAPQNDIRGSINFTVKDYDVDNGDLDLLFSEVKNDC